MGAEIGLGESNGEGGVGRKIERWVTFSPVPEEAFVSKEGGAALRISVVGVEWRVRGAGGGRGRGWGSKVIT